MTAGSSRRDALRAAAVAGAALAVPALVRPATARAQDDDPGDVEDFLEQATDLEQVAVLAYATAADVKGLDSELKRTLVRFRDQEQAHATALRSAMDSLGVDPPDAPSAPDDIEVLDGLDDVEGAEDLKAYLVGVLADLKSEASEKEVLDLLLELEARQIDLYVDRTPDFEGEDLLRTGAEISSCQRQHVVVLREARGDAPVAAVSPARG